MTRIITSNKIKCKHCDDIIESEYRHDYVICSCNKVAVDGGHDYLRRAYQNIDDPSEDFTEMSVFKDVEDDKE